MKFRTWILAFSLSLAATPAMLFSQQAEENVVVKIGGKGYSAEHLERLRSSLPEQFKQNIAHMNNKSFVDTYANLLALSNASEKIGLLEQEPFKSQFEFNRLNFLAQIYLSQINSTLSINDEEKKQYYEDHLANYSESNVSAIHVEYDPLPELAERAGREPVGEQDAWAESEKLLLSMRQGAEFADVAKEHSDDKLTANSGGVVGWLSPDSDLAPTLKKAIFELKPGQVSQAIKDGGKFYIFKINEVRAKTYSEVLPDILRKIQSAKVQEKLEEIRVTMPVEFTDVDFALAMPAKE